MNFSKSLKLRVVLTVYIIWWHITGFSVLGNMEGIDKKLNPPIEPLGKVGTRLPDCTKMGANHMPYRTQDYVVSQYPALD